MKFYLLAVVAFTVILFFLYLGTAMRDQVCIAGQTMTAEEHLVLPVECS